MPRTRLVLASGGALLVLSYLVGCCLLVILEPQPPWRDPDAQQAEWGHLLACLLGVAAVLLVGAWLLLAHGWVSWRIQQRRKASRSHQPDR